MEMAVRKGVLAFVAGLAAMVFFQEPPRPTAPAPASDRSSQAPPVVARPQLAPAVVTAPGAITVLFDSESEPTQPQE